MTTLEQVGRRVASRGRANPSLGRHHPYRRRVLWGDLHRELSQHPSFAGCTRQQIRRIAQWGDDVEVDAGEVVLREDRIGRWFIAVLSGRLELRRAGRKVTTLGPGGHVGDVAILGLGPQPLTAVTATPCRLFVLGHQRLVSLVHVMRGLRETLLPGVRPDQYVEHLRRMRLEGREAWRRMSGPARERATASTPRPAWLPRPRRIGPPQSFSLLATHALRSVAPPTMVQAPPVPLRAVAVPVAAILAVVVTALTLLWHPPIAVITPGDPVDVSADLTVNGAPTYPITGRYVLTAVDIDQPALGGLLSALLHHHSTIDIQPGGPDAEAIRRAGRQAFADSHRHALAAARATMGVGRRALDVDFRARDVQGPSAGLVYAIALVDLLTPEDLARGRTIAATGELTNDGTVLPVGHVEDKAAVARARRAVLFVVPRGQDPGDDNLVVKEVGSLKEAIAVLRRP